MYSAVFSPRRFVRTGVKGLYGCMYTLATLLQIGEGEGTYPWLRGTWVRTPSLGVALHRPLHAPFSCGRPQVAYGVCPQCPFCRA